MTEQDLIEHTRQRLAGFKRPESVVFVGELPRNPLGRCSSGYCGRSTANR